MRSDDQGYVFVSNLGTTVHGKATSGSLTTVVDTSKDFTTTAFNSKTIKITIGGIDYYRVISATAGDTITFATLPAGKAVVAGTPYLII
jgi:hypothetical protein